MWRYLLRAFRGLFPRGQSRQAGHYSAGRAPCRPVASPALSRRYSPPAASHHAAPFLPRKTPRFPPHPAMPILPACEETRARAGEFLLPRLVRVLPPLPRHSPRLPSHPAPHSAVLRALHFATGACLPRPVLPHTVCVSAPVVLPLLATPAPPAFPPRPDMAAHAGTVPGKARANSPRCESRLPTGNPAPAPPPACQAPLALLLSIPPRAESRSRWAIRSRDCSSAVLPQKHPVPPQLRARSSMPPPDPPR